MRGKSLVAVLLVLGLIAAMGFQSVQAASPSSGTVTAKPGGGSSTLSYSGTVPPGSGSLVTCEDGVNADLFNLTVEGTDNPAIGTFLTIRIEWDPRTGQAATNDLALQVYKGGTLVAESDGGETNEVVGLQNPDPGAYDIYACAFSNLSPQPYNGQISLNSTPKTAQTLPPASDPRGLQFMPIVTVDPQRDVAEPSLRVDKKGNTYVCGPFGASRAADYAQKSEDNGDTFRVLGTPPEGRIAPGGGGDCEISVAPEKNAQGNYNLSYTGLEALLNFSTGRSQDEGRSFLSQIFSSSIPAVDRQWMASNGQNEVYLFYNQIPGGGTVQRSTDGGLTYAPPSSLGNAAPDIFRPGNIVVDSSTSPETLYGTYSNENKVMVFRSRDQGQTFQQFEVVDAEGRPDNLFPSLAIDTAGNLYAAWIEKGSFNAYYSFSKDDGATWSAKQLVNRRGAQTTVMPWIEAGSPGRVAVSFYCSPVDGNPEVGGASGFHGPWDVCMNQSTNALAQGADFSQVKVTHHPIHWDSICLSGLACSTNGGDRTLLDFFQTRMDPRDGRLTTVFNESNKVSRGDITNIAIETFAKQKSGPSLLASRGQVPADSRAIVRNNSGPDPIGDAQFPFSSLGPPPPNFRQNVHSLDITSLGVSPTTINGNKAIQLTLKVRDLSSAGLTQALLDMKSAELKFVVRWVSGFQPDYVIANYTPDGSFGFFEGNLHAASCEKTADDKLEVYPAPAPGRTAIPGTVDRASGTITMKLPYSQIQAIRYGATPQAQAFPRQARSGDKIFEVTAFTFGRPQAGQPQPPPAPCSIADYYNQGDSTASFDYQLP
ncbi:hypothetical protein BH18ACT15_BH18ACT15_04200 [soil metagenome]